MYESTGTLKYFTQSASVLIDPDIYFYYRSLIPQAKRPPNGQRYPAHISVVRRQKPTNPSVWGKYEGRLVKFHYENVVRFGTIYCWLNVYSTELEEIVNELGLPPPNPIYNPDGRRCFHITLGNFKDL